MKTSRMLVTISCAALLLNGAAAFAQRGGGGHGGGGHDGGRGGFHSGMGTGHGRATSTMGHGGGFRGMSPRPTSGTHAFRGVHRDPLVRGGVVHGGNFRYGGNYYRYDGNYVRHGAFVRNHGFVGPVHLYRPYYAFRPNVSIGFGLWAGYPFAYPYAFYNPYYYSYPYYSNNRYPPYGSVSAADVYASRSGAVLDQTNMGGLSFEITPNDAELFVDNVRVGTVGEFTSTTHPLGVAAGHHHVEIRAVGYQPISFDVDIVVRPGAPLPGVTRAITTAGRRDLQAEGERQRETRWARLHRPRAASMSERRRSTAVSRVVAAVWIRPL